MCSAENNEKRNHHDILSLRPMPTATQEQSDYCAPGTKTPIRTESEPFVKSARNNHPVP